MRRLLLASSLSSLPFVVGCVEGSETLTVQDKVEDAQEQIIGGSNDTADPNHDAIVYLEGNQGACTGTIIAVNGSTGYILTAGHCNGMDIMGVGSNINNLVGYNITDMGAHPNWNNDPGNGYDFRIYSFVGANGSTKVIPAATSQTYSDGTMGTIIGWGMTIDGNQNSIPTTRQAVTKPINAIYGNPPLIEWDQTSTGFCSGDSGGPTVFNGQVIGVTSFTASNNGDCQGSGVFGYSGRVDHPSVASWIAGITGGQVQMTCDTCFQSAVAPGGACSSQYDACTNNQDCIDFFNCLDACGANPSDACVNSCVNAHPTGTDLYVAIIDCGCTACSSLCVAECGTSSTTTTTTTTGAGGSAANGTGGGSNGNGGASNGNGGASSSDGAGGGGDGDSGGSGCNCSTTGSDGSSGLAGLGALALGLGVVVSRRRRRA